ncbi:MAG: stage III sporulation protein AF [Ruminococcus sp.]|nr:stage III sporulation protein AF [Ruminococcus sp.]
MELIKEIIKAFCVTGIILSITEYLLPNNDYKKCVKFIIGLIFIISVVSPFFEDGLSLNLNIVDSPDLSKIESLEQEVTDALVEDYKESLESSITQTLKENGIDVLSVDIKAISDEYNNIEIEKIVVSSDDSEKEIQNVIKDFLETEDIEIEIKKN